MQPIEIRPNRFGYLIPIPFVLFLMWLFYKFILSEPQEPLEDNIIIYVAYFVMGVGTFLVLNFSWRFIKAPVIFRMDNEGIIYNPAGVSTGLIRWDEISDVNEVNVGEVVPNSQVNNPALAVQLKDPDEFRKRYNFVMAKALQLGNKIYHADVLIESIYLKKHYDVVKSEIKRKVPLSFLGSPADARSPLDVL